MNGYDEERDLERRQKTIRVLLEKGANPNALNSDTLMTCLHWACSHPEDSKSVEALVAAKSDLWMRETQGYLPMDIAGLYFHEKKTEVSHHFLFHRP